MSVRFCRRLVRQYDFDTVLICRFVISRIIQNHGFKQKNEAYLNYGMLQ